jgi:hypothetical protein
MMQRIEDAKPRLPCSRQDLQHMRNTIIRFSHNLHALPDLAFIANKIVVRIDDHKCSDLFVELRICHVSSSYMFT